MKILTMKATADHSNGMLPHCHGAEKTLISCFSPQPIISTCYYLLVECTNSSTQTPAITASNTSLPTDMSNTLTIQHTTQTSVITASLPTDMSGTSTEDGGVPIAVVAGIIGALVVIFVLLVTVLIVVFSWKSKKSGRYIHKV